MALVYEIGDPFAISKESLRFGGKINFPFKISLRVVLRHLETQFHCIKAPEKFAHDDRGRVGVASINYWHV